MNISNLASGFVDTVAEFWVLIFGALAAAILLYAMYLGRRGETAKNMPTYSPDFALGAFAFDGIRKSPVLSWLLTIAFIVLCIVLGYSLI